MREFNLTKDRSIANGKYEFEFIGDAHRTVIPVLQYRSGKYRIIGTASYFGHPNWFITAAHIFEGDDIANDDGFAVYIEGTSEPVRLSHKYNVGEIDVAICVLDGVAETYLGSIEPLAVTNLPPMKHEIVAAFGYSHSQVDPCDTYEDENGELLQKLNFRTKWELGGVLDIHFEGRGYIEGECFEASILAEGRDSGAPMFNSNGFLIGILSSSFEFEGGLPNSTFTSIVRIGGYLIDGKPIEEIWHKGQRAARCRRIS